MSAAPVKPDPAIDISKEKGDVNRDPVSASPKKRSSMIWGFTLLLLLAAVGWVLFWFFYLRFYEYTDDAYATGNLININAAVPGSVVSFYADNTDLVIEGQPLVRLDQTSYQIQYEKELATLAATVLEVRQLYDKVQASRAARDNRQIRLERTRYDFNNRAKLVGSLAISNEDFTHSQDDLKVAEQELKQAEYEFQMALAAVGDHAIESHPSIEKQKEQVRVAYYNLRHCAIYAPSTGFVAQRNVNVGEWAQPSRALMAVIPADYVFVDANFKETQLRNMRVGQPARVTFDLYGSDVVFEGKVLGIASGSGSVFSLIPPQNATGNWIKIVQRLPVRISLDSEKVKQYPIRLGISAEVTVDVTNVDLPMLVQTPSNRPVAKTQVFDLDLAKVNQVIDSIISENLQNTPSPNFLLHEIHKTPQTLGDSRGGTERGSCQNSVIN